MDSKPKKLTKDERWLQYVAEVREAVRNDTIEECIKKLSSTTEVTRLLRSLKSK